MRLNSSGLIWVKGANTEVKATFTQMSIGPSVCSTCSAAASTWPWSATSVGTARACPPARSMSLTTPSSPTSPRASSPTRSPLAPKAQATARPMPALAPVTTTTRPATGWPPPTTHLVWMDRTRALPLSPTSGGLGLLARGIGELQEIGDGEGGEDRRGQPGCSWAQDQPEDKPSSDPLTHAERTDDQFSHGLAQARSARLLLQLGWSRGALEGGERRPQRAGHRVLGQQPGALVGGHPDQRQVGRPDPFRQAPAAGADQARQAKGGGA